MARSRGLAALGVVGIAGAVALSAPDALRRSAWLELLALPLGYGHLIGAALSATGRATRAPVAATAWCARLCGFAAYTALLQSSALRPWLLIPMLLVSAWHIVENDRALARVGPRGRALPGILPTPGEQLRIGAWVLLLGLLALATPDGRQWSFLATGHALPGLSGFGLLELAACVLLYHALSFVGFGLARARRLGGARGARLRRRLLLCHALALLTNALLYFWLDAVHALLSAPSLYLFWSVLHAVDTAARRGIQR